MIIDPSVLLLHLALCRNYVSDGIFLPAKTQSQGGYFIYILYSSNSVTILERLKNWFYREEVEKCKDRDLLENMLAEMAGEFPALSRAFVAERDLFLAHSLQLTAESTGGGNVVAVVGLLFPAWEYILFQFDNVYCPSGFNMINIQYRLGPVFE